MDTSLIFRKKDCLLWSLTMLAIIFGFNHNAHAIDVKVVDQNGEPVEFAVISAKQVMDATDLSKVAVMDQINKQFQPNVLTINLGQQVSFPNSDNIRHHIYSFSKPKPFEIKMFKGGESKSLLFDQPGIVVLGCNIHDQMVGYIYVSDQEITAVTDKHGNATLDTQESELLVWHSRLSEYHIERQVAEINKDSGDVNKIVLKLLPQIKAKESSKFGGRKFGSGN